MSGKEGTLAVNAPSSPVFRAGITHWFTTEIQQMMYGLGDCRKPLQESALLVENIVHHHMSSLLYQASDVALQRNVRFIGLEDLLFIMRKDKAKLKRLIHYLDMRDLKASALKGIEDDDNIDNTDKISQPVKKRRKICHDFLASIDTTGELMTLFDDDQKPDEVKYERLLRAEMQSRNLDLKHYLEYCEARQINFSKKYKAPRFKDWLLAGVNIDIKPNLPAMEVLSYLAYEVVAQVVDLALKVKQDSHVGTGNPMDRTMNYARVNHVEISQELSPPQSVGNNNQGPLTSPSVSPPLPPVSTQSTNTSLSQSLSSKPKAKKRRKSGHSSSVELLTAQAIKPSEIHEAMRRYGHTVEPLLSSQRVNNQSSPKQRLLCC